MRIFLGLLFAGSVLFGQGTENRSTIGTRNDSALTWIPPTVVYSSLPGSPVTGQQFTVSDKQCDGTGSGPSQCRWSGSAWTSVSGAAAQSSIFTGGSQVQRSVQCATGTISYTTLQGAGAVTGYEVSIITGIDGTKVRYDYVQISETTQFAGTSWSSLTASMGQTGTNNTEMTGGVMPLMVSSSDANYWNMHPSPPSLSATYALVINFTSVGGNISAATAGVLSWEVCGYASK